MLFITVAPGPSTVLGGTQHRGAGWGLRVPRGCSTSGHLVLSQQLDYRHMKARTLRAAFREFFCNGCAQTKKDPGLLLLTGELMNNVLTDLGNRTMFVEVFSEPRKQLLRGNRLRECARNKKKCRGKANKPTELYQSGLVPQCG